MTIELKKFGTTLTSRDSGREAYRAIDSELRNLKEDEEIVLDFSGVNTFSPSWGDEFVVNIIKNTKSKVFLLNTENKSVVETLKLLSEINKIAKPVTIITGDDENEFPFSQLTIKNKQIIKMQGGHHYDGDINALCKQIVLQAE